MVHSLRQPSQSLCRQKVARTSRWRAAQICSTVTLQQSGDNAALLRSVLEQHLTDINQPPAVQSCKESNGLLDTIYEVLDDEVFFSRGAFVIPGREKIRIDATGGSASYGEIQATGIDQLLRC